MQMSKIACALYNYQLDAKRFYISILASPTTGGVTASFGMLGKVVIAEPEATIAFAGKRVIEQTLNIEVPEGVQQTEFLFTQGAFDLILPRFYLKRILHLIYLLNNYTLFFVWLMNWIQTSQQVIGKMPFLKEKIVVGKVRPYINWNINIKIP